MADNLPHNLIRMASLEQFGYNLMPEAMESEAG